MAYTSGIFYLDFENGSDTARTALTSCTASNPSGTITRINKTGHGLVTGAVVDLTLFTAWLNSAWKITWVDADNFDLDGAVWQATADASGTVTPRGGSSWTDAWKTITTGVTAARHQAGDTIRIAKSGGFASTGQSATWTSVTRNTGGMDNTTAITSSTNASPIVVTKAAHGYVNGDVVHITGHTTNTAANGIWLVANKSDNTFELEGSIGNGVGGASGTVRRITPACVILTSAVTQLIDDCAIKWTDGANAAASLVTGSQEFKTGNGGMKIVTTSGCTSAQVLAQYGLPSSLNLSGYKQISFWLRNNTSALAAGDLVVKLYSDAACTSEVESLSVPAITAYGTHWMPIVINKGSALSATVQGIAIYTTVSMASKTLYFDHFIACKDSTASDCLTLRTMISKETTETGTTHPWYCINAIYGKIICQEAQPLYDFCYQTFNNNRGYVGTTELAPLYKRETTPLPLVSNAYTNNQSTQNAGTVAIAYNPIKYEGGYNVSTSIIDGITILDSLNGWGYAISSANNAIEIAGFGVVRSNYGINLQALKTKINIPIITSNYMAIMSSSCYTMEINFGNVVNSGQLYLYNMVSSIVSGTNLINAQVNIGSSTKNVFTISGVYNYNSHGISLNSASNNIFNIDNSKYHNTSGMSFPAGCSGNIINNCVFSGNSNSISIACCGDNYMYNCLLSDSNETGGNQAYNTYSYVASYNHDQTADNHKVFYTLGMAMITVETGANRHTASGYGWKFAIANNTLIATQEAKYVLGKIMCVAGSTVTAKIWFKKSHATNIVAQLVARGGYVAGITTDEKGSSASSTDWNEVTLTLNPTVSGMIPIEIWAYVTGNFTTDYFYFDDFTVTQA